MIKSYTDIEQSKVLAKILPLESADMVFVHSIDFDGDEHYDIALRQNQPLFEDDVCAWSLAPLINVIPNYKLIIEHNQYTCIAETSFGKEIVAWYDNAIDACYDLIIKLNELKML